MAALISGKTRLIGFVGDPVAQARSPQIMNAIFRRQKIDTVCIPLHVGTDDFAAVLQGLKRVRNFDGLIATIPHKFALARLADDVGENARTAGAANALKRSNEGEWVAELFDGIGFVRGLMASGIDVEDKSFRILGAGGAGSAIAAALSRASVASVTIVDIDRARALDLVRKLQQAASVSEIELGTEEADRVDCDILVNATPLGMQKTDPLPVDLDVVSSKCIVADIIMKPRTTRLLKEARKRGLRVHLGHHMIDHQIPRFLEFFGFGVDASLPEKG